MSTYRLIAVTKAGSGLTFSWGDTYVVEADSYRAAEADVLGRKGIGGGQPYTLITKAWVQDGRIWVPVVLETGEPLS